MIRDGDLVKLHVEQDGTGSQCCVLNLNKPMPATQIGLAEAIQGTGRLRLCYAECSLPAREEGNGDVLLAVFNEVLVPAKDKQPDNAETLSFEEAEAQIQRLRKQAEALLESLELTPEARQVCIETLRIMQARADSIRAVQKAG